MNHNNKKLHYKMYKSGKKWVISGIITTSFFIGIENIGANADSSSTSQSNENVSSITSSASSNSLVSSSQLQSSSNSSQLSSASNSSSNNESVNTFNVNNVNDSNKSNSSLNSSSSNQNISSSAININDSKLVSSSLSGSNTSDNDKSSLLNSSDNSLLSNNSSSTSNDVPLLTLPANFSYISVANESTNDPTTIDSHINNNNNNYHYYNSDGQIQKNILITNDNKIAYFDGNGNYVDNLGGQLPQTNAELIKNDFSVNNSLYSLDPSNITNTNGFLTANSWYRPKEIFKDGSNWVQSTEKDFRPLLMVWWPNKQVQVNYLNYMHSNNLGDNYYSESDTSDSLIQGAHAVQSSIEQKISKDNGDTSWLKTLIENFVNTQDIWNVNSEGLDFNSGVIQGGNLRYNNNVLTPYANSDYRLMNRAPGTQNGKPSYNEDSYSGFEFLLANDVDNSNPIVQAEDLNWIYYLTNFGTITNNDENANFDGYRVDALDNVDSDVLQILSQYFKDAYKVDQNDANANKHISIVEGWSGNDSPYLRDHGQYQINMDNNWVSNMISSLSWPSKIRNPISNVIKSGLVDRSNDSTENNAIPNYTYLRAHDAYVQGLIIQIIKDKINSNVLPTNLTQDEIDQAFKYYNDDMDATNKEYNLYNVPSSYALILTNKDTVPRVYYGDLYSDNGQYMANKTIYNDAITSMLRARVKYVAGGQSMSTNSDGSVLTSVRYGKGANSSSDIGTSITRKSGIAVVESNNPTLSNTKVTINMGAAHKNQAYRPLLLSTNDGTKTFDDDNSANSNIIYTDSNGVLTLNSDQVKGYSNPQVSGYLSIWVPVGADSDQDVRTSPSTDSHLDGKSFHSNAALDSNVIFESFSNFQAMPQNNDQYQNVILAKVAPMLKSLGFTSIELPPQYRSSKGNSFIDDEVQNGYAFSDRYDLGFNTPTKYGNVDQLRDALKAIHAQGMQAIADFVANQLYGLNTPEVVSATRADNYGQFTGNTTINDDLYYANSIGGGDYQEKFGGEFLDKLKELYPDLFTTNQLSTGKPIDPSVKIKQWSAKYLNGSNIQGRGSDYVLRNAGNNQYFLINDKNVSLPNQLLGNDVYSGFDNSEGKVSYYTFSGQKVKNTLINIDNKYYVFDSDGNLLTNKYITDSSGNKYLSLPNGQLLTNSFYSENGKLEYFTNSGNAYENGFFSNPYNPAEFYYFNNGVALTGEQNVEGNTLFFASDGIQVKGKIITDSNGNKKYYESSLGRLVKNQNINIDGINYYADNNGILNTTNSSSSNTPSISPSSNATPNNPASISPFATLPKVDSGLNASSDNFTSNESTNSSSTSSSASSSSSTSSVSSSASSSSATSSASSSNSGKNVSTSKSNNGKIRSARSAMNKAQREAKVAEKLKNTKHSKTHVNNYNKALDNYYQAEKKYLKVAKLHNSKYYYDFDNVTKHSKYVKLSKLAYVYDSKKFNKDNRVSKVKKGTKVKVNKIVRHGKTTRFNIGHNKFITGLKSFIHKLTK